MHFDDASLPGQLYYNMPVNRACLILTDIFVHLGQTKVLRIYFLIKDNLLSDRHSRWPARLSEPPTPQQLPSKKILTKVKKQTKHSLKCFFTGQSQRTVKYKKIVLCLTIRLILGTDHSYYCPGWNGKRLRKSQIYTSKSTYDVTENSQASLVSGGLIQSLLDLFIEKNQLFQLITLPICCAQVHILL